jgi:hypothetical protein
MDQGRRSFLKSAGRVGAATLAATMAAQTSAAARAGSEDAKLSELNRLDATEIASRIARRQVSPVGVIDAALARLDATQSALNAFVAVDADGARRAARAAEIAVMRSDAHGPLHRVRVSIKDLIDVAGLPTRNGSLTMKDNIARADAVAVERLRRAGAIILGKTATPELGYELITKSLLHGITRIPWSLALTPGGSSGGAVASVAGRCDADRPRHRWRRLHSGAVLLDRPRRNQGQFFSRSGMAGERESDARPCWADRPERRGRGARTWRRRRTRSPGSVFADGANWA